MMLRSVISVAAALALAAPAAAEVFGDIRLPDTVSCTLLPKRPSMPPPHPPRDSDPCDRMQCPRAPGQCYQGTKLKDTRARLCPPLPRPA